MNRSLRSIATGALVLVAGCGSFAPEPMDPTDALAKCRDEARAAYFVGDAGMSASLDAYERCKTREGIL